MCIIVYICTVKNIYKYKVNLINYFFFFFNFFNFEENYNYKIKFIIYIINDENQTNCKKIHGSLSPKKIIYNQSCNKIRPSYPRSQKPHRFKPETITFREIRKYQKLIDLLKINSYCRIKNIAIEFRTELKFKY